MNIIKLSYKNIITKPLQTFLTVLILSLSIGLLLGVKQLNKVFESHTIKYQKGDMFYLFSDGLQDQFGGEENRKFSPKRFREMLLENSELSMKFQRRKLRKALLEWMGTEKQTDDILVIGIKF